MNSRIIASLAVAALLTTGGVLLLNRFSSIATFNAATVNPTNNTVTIDGKTFTVELAVTPDQQAAGLSNRPSIGATAGMLFLFNPPSQPYFWMKDMRFPIDIIWIRSGTIVHVTRNAPSPSAGQDSATLPMYQAGSDVDNVLEVAAGQANDFAVGDSVIIANQAGI